MNSTKRKTDFTTKNFIRSKETPLDLEYKLVKKIAKAAFGEIFIVEHLETKTQRCLKLYEKSLMENTNQNNFEEEMNIIKTLDHPNIFKIFEFFQDEEKYYLITEYLQGGELFEFISTQKSMSEKTAYIIMEQLISAVHYLHKHNIVHRDLKPENLLLAKKGDPSVIKLIDFGTSKRFREGDVFKVPLGTCYYVAPEVIKRQYDHKADIWSCGIIMYILLCGYPPFNGNSDL